MSHNDAMEQDEVTDYQEDEEGLYEGIEGDIGDSSQADEVSKRVLEMEEELEKLNKLQQHAERQLSSAADALDEKSIYVGQVDYEATPEELRAHFAPCGTINRVTIMCDKITGHPKGFAYVEFVDKESVNNALKLDESVFKNRQLKVLPKRQNVPTFQRGGFGGRGRGRGSPFRGGPNTGRNPGRGGRFTRGRGGPSGRGGRGRFSHQNQYY